jgi:hypothetical protein
VCDYPSLQKVNSTRMNSFTTDEKVETNMQGDGHFPIYPVDQPLPLGDFTLDRTQMQVQSHLLPICHGCTQEIWNKKGPLEGP